MSVFENGKALPGTTRQKALKSTVYRRRANRRLWTENTPKTITGYCAIYGWRKAARKPAARMG